MDELIVRVEGAPPGRRRDESARAAIVRAATDLFLDVGFQAAGTDRIASDAAVSKQTVYNQFGDKRSLFAAVVLGVTATAEAVAAELTAGLAAVTLREEVEPVLRGLMRRWAAAVLSPRVVAVRRLVIAEAGRFPELAAEYHRRAPEAMLRAVASGLAGLADAGLARIEDPEGVAVDLAFVLVGAELDRALFRPGTPAPDDRRLDALVEHALQVVRPLG